MPTVLVLCPTHRDHRELSSLPEFRRSRLLLHEYASLALEDLVAAEPPPVPPIDDPIAEAEHILGRYRHEAIDAVGSTDDYPGSALACIAAAHLGLPGPDPAVNLICQHKVQSRRAQGALVPDAVPVFAPVDVRGDGPLPSAIALPAFVKPVKSFFSIDAQRLDTAEQLVRIPTKSPGCSELMPPTVPTRCRPGAAAVLAGYFLLCSVPQVKVRRIGCAACAATRR